MNTHPSPSAPPVASPDRRKVQAVLGLLVLFLVLALVAGGHVWPSKGAVGTTTDQQRASADSTSVTRGTAFTHDGYRVASGWRVGRDKLTNSVTLTRVRITDMKNDAARTALLSFRFYQGSRSLAEVMCNGRELRHGETATMDCSSTDLFPATYDAIRVTDTF